jgi:hypothetical protein
LASLDFYYVFERFSVPENQCLPASQSARDWEKGCGEGKGLWRGKRKWVPGLGLYMRLFYLQTI